MKLNIGGVVEGYVCVDRKLGSEAYPLEYPDNHFDEVRCSHVLEHLPRAEVALAVKDWARVLKPGGSLKIAVPNFEWIIAHSSDPKWQAYLFGGQIDNDDFHCCAFTPAILKELLQDAGLSAIEPWTDEVDDCHKLPVSLNLAGRKFSIRSNEEIDAAIKAEKPIKIVAIMSCPRVGWTDTFGCITEAFMPLGIKVLRFSGVFWGQGLTQLMDTCLEHDADFIITIDYDSVFTSAHVHRLCQLIVENEDVDCIVPVQVRRENDYAMFTMRDAEGKLITQISEGEFKKPLSKIATGHFGLTILRADSLRKLKRPWFLAVPNKDGEWKDGHLEEDIFFWINAEQSGWKICLANEVRIGHLQNVIAWPKSDFTAELQYVSKWNEEGQPKHCGGNLEVKEAT